MSWPDQPVIYEVNTAAWLTDLSHIYNRRVTLGDVSGYEWDALAPYGVDAVWLMGVWERSPSGVRLTQADDALMTSLREVLPDLNNGDLMGSPFCIRRYDVDTRLGGFEGLEKARRELAVRGLRLILDYVPDHVAPDHPWVTQHPERFVDGSLELDAFAPALRVATITTLSDIADHCDGIRCDSADLMMNRVFAKAGGGDRSRPEPLDEFWPPIIGALRANHPEIMLFAEAHWNVEWDLQQQGFDFCYDKRLYDRLISGATQDIRDHLRAEMSFQARTIRFLESHDVPRIAGQLDVDAQRAAAVCIATLPGAALWHEGQFEARRVRLPVLLSRRPPEPLNRELRTWHEQLLATVKASRMRSGSWQLLDVIGWPDNASADHLLAWCWYGESGGDRHVIVVNYDDAPAQGRVLVPWADLRDQQWRLADLLSGAQFRCDGGEILEQGLYVGLPGWGTHVLAVATRP